MNIKILDTGFVGHKKVRATQTQLSDANRAGYTGSAVSAFTLKTANVSRSGTQNTESNPIINNNADVETTPTSASNRLLQVSLIMEKADTTSGWDKNELFQLNRLDRTKGLKILYPDVTTDSDSYKTLVEVLGAENTAGNFSDGSPSEDNGTVSSTTPYLVGRVKSLNISDTPNGTKWRINFTFEISG